MEQRQASRQLSLTVPAPTPPGHRSLSALPKAHLHLHFTSAMRPTTMVEMARTQGVRLPLTSCTSTRPLCRPTGAGGSVSSAPTTRRVTSCAPRPRGQHVGRARRPDPRRGRGRGGPGRGLRSLRLPASLTPWPTMTSSKALVVSKNSCQKPDRPITCD